jgi:hypothetical protein
MYFKNRNIFSTTFFFLLLPIVVVNIGVLDNPDLYKILGSILYLFLIVFLREHKLSVGGGCLVFEKFGFKKDVLKIDDIVEITLIKELTGSNECKSWSYFWEFKMLNGLTSKVSNYSILDSMEASRLSNYLVDTFNFKNGNSDVEKKLIESEEMIYLIKLSKA